MSEKVFRSLFSFALSQSDRSDTLPALLLSPACTILQDSFVVVEIVFEMQGCKAPCKQEMFRRENQVFFKYLFVWHCLLVKPKISQFFINV